MVPLECALLKTHRSNLVKFRPDPNVGYESKAKGRLHTGKISRAAITLPGLLTSQDQEV